MNNVLQTICDALANKKCVNTKVLDVRELTTIADYFVLTSARNKKIHRLPQMKSKKNLRKQELSL